jgi:hypothetical protein
LSDPVYQRLVTQTSHFFNKGRCSGGGQWNGRYCRDMTGPEGWCINCAGFMLQRALLKLASPPPDEPAQSEWETVKLSLLQDQTAEIAALQQEIATLKAAPAPEEPPQRERDLRQMFSDGIDVARSYGDNAFHLHTDQLERQFQVAYRRMRAGEMQNVQPSAAPPDDPEAHPREDDGRSDAQGQEGCSPRQPAAAENEKETSR